jgi:hypothetical protein
MTPEHEQVKLLFKIFADIRIFCSFTSDVIYNPSLLPSHKIESLIILTFIFFLYKQSSKMKESTGQSFVTGS